MAAGTPDSLFETLPFCTLATAKNGHVFDSHSRGFRGRFGSVCHCAVALYLGFRSATDGLWGVQRRNWSGSGSHQAGGLPWARSALQPNVPGPKNEHTVAAGNYTLLLDCFHSPGGLWQNPSIAFRLGGLGDADLFAVCRRGN